MTEYKRVEITLGLSGKPSVLPFDDRTKDIDIGDGIWFSGQLYRIQGAGYRTLEDGSRVMTLHGSTPEFYKRTVPGRNRPDLFLVHNLEARLNR